MTKSKIKFDAKELRALMASSSKLADLPRSDEDIGRILKLYDDITAMTAEEVARLCLVRTNANPTALCPR